MYEDVIQKKCQQAFHVALIEKLGIPDNAWVGLMVVNELPVVVEGTGKVFTDVVKEEVDAGTPFPECLVEYACDGYTRQRARINGSNLAKNVLFEMPEDMDDVVVYAIGFFAEESGGDAEFILAMSQSKTMCANERVLVKLAIN